MEYTIPGDPTTLTTTMKSRQKAYQHFINNYEEIYAFNKPILKAVNQCYGDKIRELKKNRMDLYSINHRKIFKKVESHFSIIPLWEYLSLIKKPTIEGEDYPDYSIFVNLIKQLIVILQYQIKKKKKMGKEYQDNIQIYPLIEINYLKEKNYSKEQYLEKINTYRDYMNVYTFECLEVNDVFCFISPTPMNEDENFSEVSYNDMSEYFETEFEEKIKQKEFNFNDLEKIIDDHVPSEIKTFITNIREASKINIEKDKIMSEILECINMEKQYKLEKLNFTWKIDKTFLLEYYLLIQISRMLYVVLIFVYENNIIEKNDLKATFEEMSKNTKKIKEIIDKLKKDSEMKKPEKIGKKTIHEFINKTNENYILLLFLIGQPDFINRLLLLDEPIRNLLKLEDLNSETTPLNLFYLFISKIQV